MEEATSQFVIPSLIISLKLARYCDDPLRFQARIRVDLGSPVLRTLWSSVLVAFACELYTTDNEAIHL